MKHLIKLLCLKNQMYKSKYFPLELALAKFRCGTSRVVVSDFFNDR